MNDVSSHDRIQGEVDDVPVVLFMRGSPMSPRCGCSAAVIEAMTTLEVKFKGIDVLTDPELRDGLKSFSNWPTIPQLYVKGEFVGGCDIVREMFESGELKELLDSKGIQTAA